MLEAAAAAWPRIESRIAFEPNSGCWLFEGALTTAGYGLLSVDNKRRYVHRLVYEQHRGPIPAGLEIDHRCRTPACCNPAHLQPVSHQTNLRRSRAATKDRCKRGHPRIPGNISVLRRSTTGAPMKICLVCKRERRRAKNSA